MELIREVDTWLSEFRAVFRRQVTFGWFVLSLWALLLHFDGSGLSSIIRYFGLASSEYYNLLHFFRLLSRTCGWLRPADQGAFRGNDRGRSRSRGRSETRRPFWSPL
jgi:hypothetical protein